MSDAGVTAATAAATGVISLPFLAAMGIDPSAMIAGLIGCTVVQTVLSGTSRPVRDIALITVGGVLFASLMTPIAAPWAVAKVHAIISESISRDAIRAATAAFLGGFAQPLLVFVPRGIAWAGNRLLPRGGSDA